jgi:hypothetical protein
MAFSSNSPEDQTILRLQARKSYALSVYITDTNGSPLDITDCTIRMIVRKSVPSVTSDDTGNLISNSQAVLVQPVLGWSRFELQASDLDFAPGEYSFSVVLWYQGFSTVIIAGPLELEQNNEFNSVGQVYTVDMMHSTALSVVLWNGKAIEVKTGPTLAPGTASFTKQDEMKLDELYAGALAAGEVLNADLIPDGVSKVIMTMAERDKLANLTLNWTDIQGKPAFGTASLKDEAYFVRTGAGTATDIASGTFVNTRIPKVILLQGISEGTAAPASGNPFSIYLKHA